MATLAPPSGSPELLPQPATEVWEPDAGCHQDAVPAPWSVAMQNAAPPSNSSLKSVSSLGGKRL